METKEKRKIQPMELPSEKILRLIEGASQEGNAEVVKTLGELYRATLDDDRKVTKSLNNALVAFKKREITLVKNKMASFPTRSGTTSYQYSDLENTLSTVNKALAEEGLTLSFNSETKTIMVPEKDYNKNIVKDQQGNPIMKEIPGFVSVTPVLRHTDGGVLTVSIPDIPVEIGSGMKDAQAVKAANTFATRMAVEAVLSLAPQEPDLDGNLENKVADIKNAGSKPEQKSSPSAAPAAPASPVASAEGVAPRNDPPKEDRPAPANVAPAGESLASEGQKKMIQDLVKRNFKETQIIEKTTILFPHYQEKNPKTIGELCEIITKKDASVLIEKLKNAAENMKAPSPV